MGDAELASAALEIGPKRAVADDEETSLGKLLEHAPRSLQEVEAECVALICCETLRLEGADFCCGYVQNWNKSGEAISERSAQKIFHAADQILKAGALTEQREGD